MCHVSSCSPSPSYAQYFRLVEHVLSVHPDKILQLPPQVLENLLRTLCFGLNHDVRPRALSYVTSLVCALRLQPGRVLGYRTLSM